MKTTIIEDKAEPVAPVFKPALYKHREHDFIVLATSPSGGVIVQSEFDHNPAGGTFDEDGYCQWENMECYTRITAPITIKFDPTQ